MTGRKKHRTKKKKYKTKAGSFSKKIEPAIVVKNNNSNIDLQQPNQQIEQVIRGHRIENLHENNQVPRLRELLTRRRQLLNRSSNLRSSGKTVKKRKRNKPKRRETKHGR
tara:strand:- start:738 stop:1067 length:330 start_codon:yes stop_codon:yes gene_type:complete